jgi:hypothetical protein
LVLELGVVGLLLGGEHEKTEIIEGDFLLFLVEFSCDLVCAFFLFLLLD